MLCKVAQRPGAIPNLTVEEFENGVWDETTEPALITTQTSFHKTSSSKEKATLFWNAKNHRLAKIYQDKIRPLVATHGSAQLPSISGAHITRSAFFVTFTRKRLTGGQIATKNERLCRIIVPRGSRESQGLAYSESGSFVTSRRRECGRFIETFGSPNDAPGNNREQILSFGRKAQVKIKSWQIFGEYDGA